MVTLRIDLESYSDQDIKKVGVYRYVDSPAFEVLLIGYKLIDPALGEIGRGLMDLKQLDLPTAKYELLEFLDMLEDPSILKTAFNANFEITALSKHFGLSLDAKQWRCTKVQAMQMGLPASLGEVAKELKLDEQKDTRGKALINYFCKPCKPTKTNGMRTRNLPEHAPEKWEEFKEYCMQDVETEDAIATRLENYPITDDEQELWLLDQKIISRGVRLDMQLVRNAIECSEQYTDRLMTRMTEITGVDNPKSVAQLKAWLEDNEGEEVTSLNKESVKDLLSAGLSEGAQELLSLRQELGKSSVSKYAAMDRSVCSDGFVRGLLEFYGANRTGRWAGRLVQVQNLPKNFLNDLDLARQILRAGDYETLEMMFGNVPDTLSQLIRTAFIASEGRRFIVADFSAIEARVIAWLSDEQWRLDVFKTHGKIYEASASQMFKIPIESIGKTSKERQKGKVAELALGYQGGPNALRAMDRKWADSVSEAELQELVDLWREASPHIVRLWYKSENACIEAIKTRKQVAIKHGVSASFKNGCLFIHLPSGRKLAYYKAKLEPDNYGRDKITYWGVSEDKEKKGGKRWQKLRTYGGKLVENIVQAIARDCLAVALKRIDARGLDIAMHVHDEAVIDAPYSEKCEEVDAIMGQPIDWAPGLPLTADSYETVYYRKD